MNTVNYWDIFHVEETKNIPNSNYRNDRFVICDVANNVKQDTNGYGFKNYDNALRFLSNYSNRYCVTDERDIMRI